MTTTEQQVFSADAFLFAIEQGGTVEEQLESAEAYDEEEKVEQIRQEFNGVAVEVYEKIKETEKAVYIHGVICHTVGNMVGYTGTFWLPKCTIISKSDFLNTFIIKKSMATKLFQDKKFS